MAGLFALLALSLSSCVYSGRPVRYYDRPAYSSRPYYRVQPRTRVVVVPRYDRHHRNYDRHHHDNGRRRGGRY
ncbi:hypothetical protein [Emticicia fontis]